MTGGEKVVFALGAWFMLACIVNGYDGRWHASTICLMFGMACFTWVFGKATDRAKARREREHRDLVDRLDAEVRAEEQAASSGEWIRNEEGFYVRRQPR